MFFKIIFTWWNRQTLGTFLKTLFFGKLMGVDENGNKYYKDKLPIHRMCSQNEVSNTIVFLCSALSSCLPGVIIKQDGVGN